MSDEQKEAYSRDELTLDRSTAEWTDGAVWFEGTTDDGREISAGFEPVGLSDNPRPEFGVIATPQATARTNQLFARTEYELAYLHDPDNKMNLGIK